MKPFGHVSGKIWISIFKVWKRSTVFPICSAVFCPLFFFVFPIFRWFSFSSFHDHKFCCIHLSCFLERCCKCQNLTTNSSETAFCAQWQPCPQIQPRRKKPCPQSLAMLYSWDLELDLPRLCVRRYWNQNNICCDLSSCIRPRTIKDREKNNQSRNSLFPPPLWPHVLAQAGRLLRGTGIPRCRFSHPLRWQTNRA